MGVMAAESLEQDFLFVALTRALGVAQEKQVGRGAEENAAVADFEAAGQVPADRQVLALGPDCHLVRLAGPPGVLEDLDAITRFLALGSAAGVLEALHDPNPAAL